MAKVNQDTDKYKCDKCGSVFEGRKVKLVKPIKNITMMPLHRSLIFVDERGVIAGGLLKKGDKLLSCPKCNEVHLFGFEKAN